MAGRDQIASKEGFPNQTTFAAWFEIRRFALSSRALLMVEELRRQILAE